MDSFDTADSIGPIHIGHDGIMPANPQNYEQAVQGMARDILFRATVRVQARRGYYPIGIQCGFVYHHLDVTTQAYETARALSLSDDYFQHIVDEVDQMGELLLMPPYPLPIIEPVSPATPDPVDLQVVPNFDFSPSAHSVITDEESCASNAPPVMGRGHGRGRGRGHGRERGSRVW